jgi:hypothetical protein
MKKVVTFLSVAIIGILLASCNAKKPAIGLEDEIFVFADSTEYYNLEGTLLDVFAKIIYTPQPEKLFKLKRKDISLLGEFQNRKNIIIAAPLNSNSETAKFIKSILDSNVTKLVMEDSVHVINKYDLWAKNQLVMILTAPTLEKLKKDILFDHDNLVKYFQKISNQRLYQKLYARIYEKKKTEAKLLEKYGWIIYVQTDFILAKDDSVNNFVWLRRAPNTNVERWIFVKWIDNATPVYLNKDSVYALRNRITQKYYRASDDTSYVEIADNYLTTTPVNFKGRYALMTQGLWRMTDQSMGGPFVNYTFYDEKSHRLYMLDGSIYAPKYRKKQIIQQVDVLLQSFLTKDELSKDRIEDLLDELN